MLAQTSELGGVTTTLGTVNSLGDILAQTSELGGVTTVLEFPQAHRTFLHRPLSSEGLRLIKLTGSLINYLAP